MAVVTQDYVKRNSPKNELVMPKKRKNEKALAVVF